MKKFIVSDDGLFTDTERSALEKAMSDFVETDVPVVVECILASEDEIRSLNREQRGIDRITDVLSFPALDGIFEKPLKKSDFPYDIDEDGRLFLGSVVLCKKRAEEQAEEYGHSVKREIHYLCVHGFFHLLGYDHMTDEDKAKMRKKEEAVMKKLQIARD